MADRRERPVRGRAHVGCSGWSYDDWRGRLYPADLPRSGWFREYTRHFDSVELNSTFYRLPAETTVDRWCEQAPDGFRYAVKVGQFGTHRKKLKDPTQWLARHLERVEHLGGALGPQLVQLPPRWRRDVGRLEEFLAATPRHLRWAVELRDPSWCDDEVYAVLERHGAALCWHDLLPGLPWLRTTDWTYVRLHGPDAVRRPYHGRYGRSALTGLARRLEERLAVGEDVYAYFNNDQQAAAVRDAALLRDLLGTQVAAG